MQHSLKSGAACIFLATTIATLPAKADCDSLLTEAREIARNIVVTFNVPKPLSAGASMNVAWTYRSMTEHRRPKIPTYVVITAPAELRFAGKGFMALSAGAEAPYRMIYGRTESRAFVPQHRSIDKAKSGEIGVKSYRSGMQTYGWAVVAAGSCGEQILSRGKLSVDVVPGAAKLVIQDRFSTEKPKQRILSRAKTHELLIFPNRYEVHGVATGEKIVDRPGTDPNFSPTGRFVAARTRYTLEIFDLVSGTFVQKFPASSFLAWARGDSFVVAGARAWGSVSLVNTIVEQGEVRFANVSCHACSAWENVQVILDTNRSFLAAVGASQIDIQDLITGEAISNDLSSTQTPTEFGLGYIRQTYDPQYPGLPKIWSLGEKLTLSHAFQGDEPEFKTQLGFIVRHLDIPTTKLAVPPVRMAALKGRGLAALEISSAPAPKISNVFARLSDAGISTRVPPPISHVTESAGTNALLADIIRRVPEAKNTFRSAPQQCSFDSLSDDEIAIDPLWIDQVYEWKEGQNKAWLMQATCYAGSGAFVNAADIIVIHESSKGKKIHSILKMLGDGRPGETAESTSNVLVFRDDERRIIVVSPLDAVAAVVKLDTNTREGSLLSITETELFSDARRTPDGHHLIQVNSDGRFFVYRIADGKRVLDGAYIDDEIVVMTEDGRYDTTYEGAYAVQVRFAGLRGLFSFSQFESLLRHSGLANAILAGEKLSPARAIIAPPTAEFSLPVTPIDGRRIGRVIAASERNLSAIRLYVDGRMLHEVPVKGQSADIPVELSDPGGGRWVSVVAIDEQGLTSLPSAIKLPGPPRPHGKARVVAIGVDKYSDPNINTLSSAKIDAKNFVQAMATRQGRAFTEVHAVALLDADVTPASVLEAIKNAVRETGPDDTMVVYFAGHGVDGTKLNQPDAGLILTTNLTRLDDLASTSVRWTAVAAELNQSRGTVIVVLDACQSGIAGSEAFTTNDAVVSALNTKANAPLVVLAGSKGRQLSQETKGGGGRFTNAIVAAISAERTRQGVDRNALIDLGELYSSVKARVVGETQGEQTPWLTRNGLVGEMSLF